MGTTIIHLGFLLKGIPQLSEQVIALVRPKRYNGVCSRDQPRVTQHYEYRWFWSDWMIAHTPIKGWIKMIGPLTDHEVQSMKISTFFNTYKTSLIMNYIGQASIFQLSKLMHSLTNQLRDIQHRFLEKGWFTTNQLDHELNIMVRDQPGDTSEKIFRKSRTTGMLLSSRTILLFRARRYDEQSKDLK